MKVTYIGGGNMAAALIGGWLKAGGHAAEVSVLEVDAARRAALTRDYGVATPAQAETALAGAQIVVLAVKPQQMRAACSAIAPYLGQATVLSIAAGIRMRELARWLNTQHVVRAMPNTPALIGQGISGVAALPSVSASARQSAEAILKAAGAVVWLDDEAQLDAVTALSGSGPAYVFFFLEALIRSGEALGLTASQARLLAVHTVIGAGQLAAQSDDDISVLRERVTSKGGTTAAGLQSMTQDHVAEALVRAVRAAHQRAVELGNELGND